MVDTVLEGTALYSYGHSWLGALPLGIQAGQRYPDRAARRLGMAYVNNATSGNIMVQTAFDALYGPKAWHPGASGVVVVDSAINDIWRYGADPLALRGFENGLRSLAWFTALTSYADDDSAVITRSGGVVQQVGAYTGGHNWKLTQGNYGSARWTFTGRRTVFGFAGVASAGAADFFDVLLDGQLHTTVDLTVAQCTPLTYSTPMVMVIDTDDDGPHTVQIGTHQGLPVQRAETVYLDYVGTPSADPVPLVLVKALTLPGVPGISGQQPVVDQYNAIIDRVAQERPGSYVCDPSLYWDPAAMIGADGLHPDAHGYAHIADALEQTLLAVSADHGFSPALTR